MAPPPPLRSSEAGRYKTHRRILCASVIVVVGCLLMMREEAIEAAPMMLSPPQQTLRAMTEPVTKRSLDGQIPMVEGPFIEVTQASIEERDGQHRNCTAVDSVEGHRSWECSPKVASARNIVIEITFVVRRHRAAMAFDPINCSRAEEDFDDAVEVSVVSPVARVPPHRIERVMTSADGKVAVYRAFADIFEDAVYDVAITVRYVCGAQLATWVAPSPGPVMKAPWPTPAWAKRWTPLGLGQADFAARWTAPECLVDRGLLASNRTAFDFATTRDFVGIARITVEWPGPRQDFPLPPLCSHISRAEIAEVFGSLGDNTRSKGRWVRSATRVCPPRYCVGDYAGVLYDDDPNAHDLGWVYVPSRCRLEYPRAEADVWAPLQGKLFVLLGDSTTSDTLYHFARVVLRSITEPPRRRWNINFEVNLTSASGASSMTVRHQRIGNVEGDKETGWFDTLRGLEHFYAPYQLGKLRQWLMLGATAAKTNINAFELSDQAAGGLKQRHSGYPPRYSDVGADVPLSGRADVLMIHSGPHDRRRVRHYRKRFEADMLRVKKVVQTLLAQQTPPPLKIWRGNVVGAGSFYRCSKLENPWIYREMDRVAGAVLLPSDGWVTLDVAPVMEPWHWGLQHSDGIHYGRYAARYNKITMVDRAVAVLWWNLFRAYLEG